MNGESSKNRQKFLHTCEKFREMQNFFRKNA